MSRQIRLGEVRAVSVEHSWQLTATVHARLNSASSSTSLPFDNLLACIKEYSPFISRASGLHLAVRLLQNGLPFATDGARRNIVLALEKAFAEAALWKQLELDITLRPAPSSTTNDSAHFVLELRHASNIDAPEKRRLHRLPVGTSAADLHPPGGIAWLGLEDIVLELDYRYVEKEKELSGKHDQPRAGQLAQSLRKVGLARRASQADDVFEDGAVLVQQQNLNDSSWLLDEEDTTFMTETRMSPRGNSLGSGLALQPADLECQDSRISTIQALELADAAVRSIVRPRPEKLAIGTWLPKGGLELHLATLAPSLWQPRYAMAMNERVCFLPTITHALSRGLQRRAQSASLKQKLQTLQDQADETFHEADPAQPAVSSLSRLLQARLWQVVQQGVWVGDASRSLKPLAIAAEPAAGDVTNDLTQADRIRMSLRDVTWQRQPQADAGATLRNTPSSPVLQGLGLLHTSQATSWDGGLLAQPVSSILTQPVRSAELQAQVREQDDFEGFEDMLENDDDFLFSDMSDDEDSLFEDEQFFQRDAEPHDQVDLDDSMLLETQLEHRDGEDLQLRDELASRNRDHDDNDSLFSCARFEPSFRAADKDSLLDDDDDDDDTPPTSQGSTSTMYSAKQDYMAFQDPGPVGSSLSLFEEPVEAQRRQRGNIMDEMMYEHGAYDLFEDLEDEDILAF